MNVVVAAALGVLVGHGLRRATPWLARIRHDAVPFSLPWVELLAGSIAGAVALWAPAPAWYLFAALLIAITSTDFLCKLIPDRITFPGTALGIICSAIWWAPICGFLNHGGLLGVLGLAPGPVAGSVLALAGAAVGFGALEAMRRGMGALVGMEVMGMGDSKLLMLVGSFLGPTMVVLSVAPGLVFGLVFGVIYTRISKTPHLPFGPALCAGALVTLFAGERILASWRGIGEAVRTMSPGASLAVTGSLMGVAIWMLLRIRKRRVEYTRQIEEDYDALDERD